MPEGIDLQSFATPLAPPLRVPPANVAAEHAVLGSILANNDGLERIGFLRPDHFAIRANGLIFRAIQGRIGAGDIADAITVASDLDRSGVLKDIGGREYIAKLLTSMVTHDVEVYGRVIFEKWQLRNLIQIGERIVNSAFGTGDDLTAQSQIEKAEQAIFTLASGGNREIRGPVKVGEAMRRAFEEGERTRRGEVVRAASTGLPSLDRRILGLRPGHLIIVAGRPGMGKTALSRTIGMNVAAGLGMDEDGCVYDNAKLGRPVCYFALEEEVTDWGAAGIAQIAGVPIKTVLGDEISVDEAGKVVRAIARNDETPLLIYDQPRQSLQQIATQARQAARQYGQLGLIVVDYLQLMPDAPGMKDKRLAVGANAYGLKDLAKELQCPVMLLSQLSRAVESTTDKRPSMNHLRETGEIEDAADAILLIFRQEVYVRNERPVRGADADISDGGYRIKLQEWEDRVRAVQGHAEIIIPKVRRAEAPVQVDLYFNGAKSRFEEASA